MKKKGGVFLGTIVCLLIALFAYATTYKRGDQKNGKMEADINTILGL